MAKLPSSRGSTRRPRSASVMASGHQRVRDDHAQELAEDYVELIHDLIGSSGEARTVDVAERLGVTHVAVTRTVSRLIKEGLLTSAPYRSIFLTEKGRRLAEQVRKRHEIVTRFLLQLGVPPKIAEQDAEGIEHHVSPHTLQAMRRFIELPQRS